MKTSFLDYYKLILSKVSFDQKLLRKEYAKALGMLNPPEVQELNKWCRQNRLMIQKVRDVNQITMPPTVNA
ncbi:MAG: hypothetical protein Roseis2KO_35050 [Roseivirga sp.]